MAPTVKHLFGGFDVTLFAYGVTGTGKTHTMRGGKTLSERGVIPRLLSSIYRKRRRIEKDSAGAKHVQVAMSYYEIYNDRVFDLFEPSEKRTLAGLPIRDNNGKTVVAGLTERPCTTLKDFESLYDEANLNRSTAGTKLNAFSSRSHAILCVKVSQVEGNRVVTSTASAIDLAGSEDNRRTENGKERLVESSSINKSLFVLAQCVEAIGKKQSRIPYRESKMTRILSLGQNNGLTIMILNLAPIQSYHLDTLSSLTLANRTKKIEVREVENEPVFRGAVKPSKTFSGTSIQRQPLRPIPSAANVGLSCATSTTSKDKPAKAFSVYAEKRTSDGRSNTSLKRPSHSSELNSRPTKLSRPNEQHARRPTTQATDPALSRTSIEELVNRMVDERLASKTLQQPSAQPVASLPVDVQRRLEALEHRVESHEDSRAEGLQCLLMAKQHQAHGEDASALRMYRMALPFFPENEKLGNKMLALQRKLAGTVDDRERGSSDAGLRTVAAKVEDLRRERTVRQADTSDDEYREDVFVPDEDDGDEDELSNRPAKPKSRQKPKRTKFAVFSDDASSTTGHAPGELTPRTSHMLSVINTRDLGQIRSLKGVGAKKAEAIVNALVEVKGDEGDLTLTGLERLGACRGVGEKTLETMRRGVLL